MRIGYVTNCNFRERTPAQQNRFQDLLDAQKSDVLLVGGNFSGSGYDLRDMLRAVIGESPAQPVYMIFGGKDFYVDDTMTGAEARYRKFCISYPQYHYAHGTVTQLNSDTVLVGENSWYDTEGIHKGVHLYERSNIHDFYQNSYDEYRQKAALLAQKAAERLKETMAKAYELKPKKIIVMAGYPGAKANTDFGGKRVIPPGMIGAYYNRQMYPQIGPGIVDHPDVAHFVITPSHLNLGNNSAIVAPNCKEFLCVADNVNAQGHKDVALHSFEI